MAFRIMSGICMIGAFPPPVHGVTVINSCFADYLDETGIIVHRINLSSESLRYGSFGKIRRLLKAFILTFKFAYILFTNSINCIYIALSGGHGQIYESVFLLIAIFFRIENIYVHHHSFAYLDKQTLIAKALTKLGGEKVNHIVLCSLMERKLKLLYPDAKNTLILSNSLFVYLNKVRSEYIKDVNPRTSLKRIAFLGNISENKGILDFLDVIKACNEKSIYIEEALIAGPFHNGQIEKIVLEKISEIKNIKYVGPKYGVKKEEFLKNIDLLFFPTKYIHEAEPMTILEVLSHGIPVIAINRGCIFNIVPPEVGLVLNSGDQLIEAAVNQISRWVNSPSEFMKCSEASNFFFMELSQKNIDIFNDFIALITSKKTQFK